MNIFRTAIAGALFLSASAANAITVDADAFAEGTVLDNAFAGVTLSIVGNNFGSADGSSVVGVNPSTQGAEPFTASTGSLTFGHITTGNFPHLFREPSFKGLRADFLSGAASVAIDFISNDNADTGFLQAFAADDSLLGSYTTASLSTSNFETMSLSGIGDIAYIIASGLDGASSGGLDNLNWEPAPVPVPAAGLLLITALGGLSLARRRAPKLA